MSNQSDKHTIESILKLFSFLYILLITCGVAYNYFFYLNFGIRITEYLVFSEAILLFVPLLADPIVFMFLFSVAWNLMNKNLLFNATKNYKKGESELIHTMLLMCLITVIIIIILSILNYYVVDVSRGVYLLIIMAIIFFLPFLIEFIYLKYNTESYDGITLFREIIYITIMCISVTFWASYSKTERVYRPASTNFEIQFINQTQNIKSGDSLHYLGRTKDYMFIYNVSDKITRVIKGDGVLEIRTWEKRL